MVANMRSMIQQKGLAAPFPNGSASGRKKAEKRSGRGCTVLIKTDRSLRLSEAARLIGVTKVTLRAMGSRGEGPKYMVVGSERRYWLADVEAWLSTRETGGEGA
jgi:excisionase family DNA binding protein